MGLTSEDTLKLNVLLQGDVEAVRIDEARMIVHALHSRTESRIRLNPDCRPDQYLKQVREMLSGQVLGSPGGYPVFLKRWTRMGQTRDACLAQLLILGEPEAVAAVTGAPGLTDELARRAWWADPVSENARRMLEREVVVKGAMGKILAQHLVEHLAFETEPQVLMDTVRLVLQPGLIDEPTKRKFWTSGARKNAYRVGFLQAIPDALPPSRPARPDSNILIEAMRPLANEGNTIATTLLRVSTAAGQTFLSTAKSILRKPANQDVVVALLNTLGDYFAQARQQDEHVHDIEQLVEENRAFCQGDRCQTLARVLHASPAQRDEIEALMLLTRVNEGLVTPIFAKTTAQGTLMRTKIEPVSRPVFRCIDILLGEQAGIHDASGLPRAGGGPDPAPNSPRT